MTIDLFSKIFKAIADKKTLFALFSIIFFALSAQAQKKDDGIKTEFAFEAGSLLPDQIDGVTEILSMYAGSFALVDGTEAYSVSGVIGSDDDVSWKTISLDYKLNIMEVGGLMTTAYWGPDAHIIKKSGDSNSTTIGGAHIGAQIMAYIGGGTYGRINMRINAGPGVSLFIGFGLAYRPSEDN